ncbi:putative RNA polymerase sigma factor protein [Bradyrhizobium sp. ORS 375]|uniref:RNA polymerase sigma factor n=1 Tax=Bradyrhizobium sp. (strain ORS 375) TaxID=566679 RepID=UPI0002406F65|nr:sigma-70 family RNA polymerase sigma factor [Bradyrhizobium sp. ORS 375]CCD95119.1 putative RNA polymerase sigma factor protein [Bradyrhizobium sp. ORS 375]
MSAMSITDETFEAARLGDRDAVVRLLERVQPDIRRYARASCRTSADSEDAAQQALWLLSRHVGNIRALAALSSWLFRVVRRECLRLARRIGLMDGFDEAAFEARLAERPEAELRLDLAAAFEALPPLYREVALMRDLREMTIDDIAAELGLSRQAVKARLHRARLLLRDYLKG